MSRGLRCRRTDVPSAITALTAEVINTSIERLGRAITREYDPNVRDALDVASAAVLVMSVGAAAVAALIVAWPLLEMMLARE